MTVKSILLRLLNIKGAKVDGVDFEDDAAWMFKGGLSRKRISEWLKIDFKTVGRLIKRVWNLLEPDPKVRYNGLVNIGIDETSYRKGHSYITVVVNHDTNTVVWAHDGHGKEIIEKFFEELSEAQRSSILLVSGDGARWITDAVQRYCPNARRCLDPFHVVECANDALGSMRIDAMISLIMLFCSSVEIPWPGRTARKPAK